MKCRRIRSGALVSLLLAASAAQPQPSTPPSEYRVVCDQTCLRGNADDPAMAAFAVDRPEWSQVVHPGWPTE